ncbi:hypothetical protein C8Q77DRAFT_609957 [Trametes polyzona]|nr:hypothetical protein C8Q77DRAFT_609957 [Trametes polyzona]
MRVPNICLTTASRHGRRHHQHPSPALPRCHRMSVTERKARNKGIRRRERDAGRHALHQTCARLTAHPVSGRPIQQESAEEHCFTSTPRRGLHSSRLSSPTSGRPCIGQRRHAGPEVGAALCGTVPGPRHGVRTTFSSSVWKENLPCCACSTHLVNSASCVTARSGQSAPALALADGPCFNMALVGSPGRCGSSSAVAESERRRGPYGHH